MADTRRLNSKPQDLTDAYGPPSNFLEIDIFNPQTVGVGRARYTSYELRMRVGAFLQHLQPRGREGALSWKWGLGEVVSPSAFAFLVCKMLCPVLLQCHLNQGEVIASSLT